MALTKEQREQRRHSIGGSDIAKLYDGRILELYNEKVYPMTELKRPEFSIGDRMESVILDWFQDKVGEPIARSVRVEHQSLPIAVNIDGQMASGITVEAKWSRHDSVSQHPVYGNWGEEGTDEVPVPYIMQVHGAMAATDTEYAELAAYVGRRAFQAFRVTRNEDLIARVLKDVSFFWDRHVLRRVPPATPDDIETMASALSSYKRIIRSPGKVLEVGMIDKKLAEKWRKASDVARDAGKQLKLVSEALQAALLQQLGDAEVGLLPDGRAVTYFQTDVAGYTVKPLSYRTLRIVDQEKIRPQLEAARVAGKLDVIA